MLGLTGIKYFLCSAIQKGWSCGQLDFQLAFPNGNLHRPVYVERPKYVFLDENCSLNVFKLRKNLYGLMDAARIWHMTMKTEFEMMAFSKPEAAPSIFTTKHMLVTCYMDNLLTFAEDKSAFDELKVRLDKKFMTKDLGILRQF